MKFQIVIFDGFDELDVFGVFEPLVMAGFDVSLLSLRQQDKVSAINGIKVIPDGVLDLLNRPDVLIVPGGGWLAQAATGAWAEAQKGEILSVLKSFHKAGVTLASVCTGGLLLAKAGLVNGRPATTNHAAIDELRTLGAKIVNARVVDDGNIITAGGITSSLDLGLWLVERYASVEKAKEISSKLEFVMRGPISTISK